MLLAGRGRDSVPRGKPRFPAIERIRNQCGQRPADGPCHPDAHRAEAQPFGKEKGEGNTEEQIGKGAGHELQHGRCAAQHPVTHDLEDHNKIERCHDPQKINPYLNGSSTAFFHEKCHGPFAAEEIEQEEGHADDNAQQSSGFKPFRDPFRFFRPQILGGEGGKSVGKGGHAGDAEYIQLLAGRETGHYSGTIAVDSGLYKQISNRNEALLQNTGNGDDGHLFQHGEGKFFIDCGGF